MLLQARYVEAQLQLEGLSSVSADTALLLPGTMGISLQAKSTDSALRGKLEMQLELAAIGLGLAAGGSVTLSSLVFKTKCLLVSPLAQQQRRQWYCWSPHWSFRCLALWSL